MNDQDILAELAGSAPKATKPKSRPKPKVRQFPVYIARRGRHGLHCGHQHSDSIRASNCAANKGPDWVVLEAHADGKELMFR
jgi:hypothetical protein